jgi:hypothetical protein
MTSVAPPTEFFPGINFNASFYNLGQSAVTLDYLNSNFLRSTGYAISRAQYTLFNGSVNIQQNLDVSQNINAGGYALNGVPVTFSQWTTSGNDIYYNTGNVGIGKTNPSTTYKLDVSGNINADKIFIAGTELTQYTDTNVRTVLSTSAGTNMTWNTGTNKFDVAAPYTDTNTRTVLSTSAGTNMTWNTGTNKFDVAAPYTDTNTRTVLSTSAGTNMTWNTGTNKFDVAVTSYVLPIASNGVLGGVKPDVDTIIVNPSTGLISLSGSDISLNGTADRAYGWTSSTSLLGRAAVAGSYSSSALVNDVILRSANNLIFQSGITNPALTINTTNQALFRNAVGIGTTSITAGFALHVVGAAFFSQPVRLSSAASTSYFWDGNGNTFLGRVATAGIYSNLSAVGDLVLSSDKKILMKSGPTTNGCALCVDLSNNIGIGITTPTSKLHIPTLTTTTNLLDFRNGSNYGIYATSIEMVSRGNTLDFLGRDFNFGSTVQTRNVLSLAPSGRVGIGTTVTSTHVLQLHRPGTVPESVMISFTDSFATSGLLIGKQSDNRATFFNQESADMVLGVISQAIVIKPNGAVGIQQSGYALPNNFMANGSLTIGNNGLNYGGGNVWNSNTAGLLMECDNNTEIAVHDSGTAIHSFMYYTTNGNFTIGRNMGYGVARVNMPGDLIVNSYILSNGRVYSRNGGYDTWIYSDSGGMSLNMGNQSTENAPSYFKMGAYAGHTFYESSQNRNHRFFIYPNVLSGTSREWRFNEFGNAFNANNSTSWTIASDQRIKKDIIKADLKTCYDNVKNINLYRFKYIDAFDSEYQDKNKLGYIAQEVKRHFPKATYREKRRLNDKREIPDLLNIDTEQINFSLYGAVKQLIKIVEKQDKRIKTLESLLNIEDNNDVEDDAGETYERIYDDDEVNIDDIEPSEPSNEV